MTVESDAMRFANDNEVESLFATKRVQHETRNELCIISEVFDRLISEADSLVHYDPPSQGFSSAVYDGTRNVANSARTPMLSGLRASFWKAPPKLQCVGCHHHGCRWLWIPANGG